MFKLKYHVQLMGILTGILLCFFHGNAGSLAYGHDIVSGQHFFVHFLQIIMHMRAMHAIGAKITVQAMHFSVRHIFRLGNHTDHIHTEAINALFTPPGHHIEDFLTHRRIIPVQIRLFRRKQMKEIHLALFIILPCRTAKAGAPVVRRLVAFFAFSPDIVITIRCILCFAAFHKPTMLIGSMVYHQIHDDLYTPFMGFGKHFVKVLHGSEFFHNSLIITDIVSVIVIWRLVYR